MLSSSWRIQSLAFPPNLSSVPFSYLVSLPDRSDGWAKSKSPMAPPIPKRTTVIFIRSTHLFSILSPSSYQSLLHRLLLTEILIKGIPSCSVTGRYINQAIFNRLRQRLKKVCMFTQPYHFCYCILLHFGMPRF